MLQIFKRLIIYFLRLYEPKLFLDLLVFAPSNWKLTFFYQVEFLPRPLTHLDHLELNDHSDGCSYYSRASPSFSSAYSS
jgi:hypothetical protein